MDHILKQELVKYLKTFVSEHRLQLFYEKLNLRTRNITLVLEDVFQSRNISAAVRSADCFGIQDIHIIENKNKYVTDESVSLGWKMDKYYTTQPEKKIHMIVLNIKK